MTRFELPCPEDTSGCKYVQECGLLTTHHIVPRRVGKAAVAEAMANGNPNRARLIRNFIESPFNKALLGRCIHDLYDQHTEDLPSEESMRRHLSE